MEGVNLENADIFLIDNELQTITNLKEGAYTFSSEQTIQTSRFVLVFENQLLSTDDNSLDTVINVYPNPTNGQLTINFGDANIERVSIYDVTGRIVRDITVDTTSTMQRLDVTTVSYTHLTLPTTPYV